MGTTTLGGTRTDRWSMASAVQAMLEAVRFASLPGLIWVAGFYYPGINLNADLLYSLLGIAERSTGIELLGEAQVGGMVLIFAPRAPLDWEPWIVALVGVPLILVLSRLTAGMARVSDPRLVEGEGALASALESGILTAGDLARGRPLRIRTAWRAGRGLGLATLGLWLILIGLLIGAGILFMAPVFLLVRYLGLEEMSGLLAGLLILPLLLLVLYAAVLMVLNQLALHSLAHNRRGVSSALTHALRLVRAAPRGGLRACAVDTVLAVCVLTAHLVIQRLLGQADLGPWAAVALVFPLYAFAGVVRAGFWARAYRSLGGMSAGDLVPGL